MANDARGRARGGTHREANVRIATPRRGVGVQREAVRAILSRTPFVEHFSDAPPEAGGWGATVATLAAPTQEGGPGEGEPGVS